MKDQDEAKQFYTEKFGFEICNEIEISPDWKYITVAPQKNNETVIELAKSDAEHQPGDQIIIMFATNDIQKDYKNMKANGVVFHGEPKKVPGGTGVGFEDLYGNQFDLFQEE